MSEAGCGFFDIAAQPWVPDRFIIIHDHPSHGGAGSQQSDMGHATGKTKLKGTSQP